MLLSVFGGLFGLLSILLLNLTAGLVITGTGADLPTLLNQVFGLTGS